LLVVCLVAMNQFETFSPLNATPDESYVYIKYEQDYHSRGNEWGRTE